MFCINLILFVWLIDFEVKMSFLSFNDIEAHMQLLFDIQILYGIIWAPLCAAGIQ